MRNSELCLFSETVSVEGVGVGGCCMQVGWLVNNPNALQVIQYIKYIHMKQIPLFRCSAIYCSLFQLNVIQCDTMLCKSLCERTFILKYHWCHSDDSPGHATNLCETCI